MTLWCFGTFAHFLLTSHRVRFAGTADSGDEHWFQTMVAGTGSLLLALHLVSSTIGLTTARVLLALAVGHTLAWYLTPSGSNGAPPGPDATRPESRNVTLAMEFAAALAITAVSLQWLLLAMTTADVTGSDAAHYHVPNAVNLALGASPFDLPASQHLYPMGSSMLAAWFILPVQTTLLTDLVLVLPFLLLLASAGWLFRQLTSLSGLAWATWAMLALFGTPLFRSTSLMSADLLFAAATLALAAALLAPISRGRISSSDLWLVAVSLGLLLGAKVTGVVVAVLLGAPAVVMWLMLWRRGNAAKISAWTWAGGAIAIVGAGGIWLIRNWWVWGSPVAPNGIAVFGITVFPGAVFEATTYLSVLGDMTETPGYALRDQVHHYVTVWLGSGYHVAMGALLVIPLDAVITRWRTGSWATSQLRLGVCIAAGVTGAVLSWFLIGAPWTSLEWTQGFSLRYALPWFALLPLLAWAGMFLTSVPWYRHTGLAALVGFAVIALSLVIFSSHPQVTFPPLPTWGTVLAALMIVAATRGLHLTGARVALVVATVAVGLASLAVAQRMSRDNLRAVETLAGAMSAGERSLGGQIYDAALAVEARDHQVCDTSGRRFFVTNRFDAPLALQGPLLGNQVFYAARDVRVTATVRPAMGPCDYIITERAIMDTDKGAALHAGLNTSGKLVDVATVGDVVLLVHR